MDFEMINQSKEILKWLWCFKQYLHVTLSAYAQTPKQEILTGQPNFDTQNGITAMFFSTDSSLNSLPGFIKWKITQSRPLAQHSKNLVKPLAQKHLGVFFFNCKKSLGLLFRLNPSIWLCKSIQNFLKLSRYGNPNNILDYY